MMENQKGKVQISKFSSAELPRQAWQPLKQVAQVILSNHRSMISALIPSQFVRSVG